jgi:hypothetical protein
LLANKLITEIDLIKVKCAVLQHESKTLLKNYDKMRAGWLKSSNAKTSDELATLLEVNTGQLAQILKLKKKCVSLQ